ncbi:MAG: sugar phosphate isomerase/epimerase [Planctomycetota bacterium]
MLANHKFGTTMPPFSGCADRYCLGGYGRGGKNMQEWLQMAKKVKGLDGIELVGNWHVNDDNIYDVAGMFKDKGLEICLLTPDLWTQAKWGRGSLAAPDMKTRQQAIDEVKKVVGWANELNCPYINVWPGQDGYDYSFGADFLDSWKWLHDGLAECAKDGGKTKILVEYKPKEPRKHCFVDHVGTVLLLLANMDDVGVLLDWGHAFQGGENVAEAAVRLSQFGKLDYLHLNDNYRSWDDDMMVGALHLVEYLELVYWLRRVDYKGWLTLDIFPFREDGIQAVIQSKEWLEAFFRAVDRVGMDAFTKVIKSPDPCKASELVRKAINI